MNQTNHKYPQKGILRKIIPFIASVLIPSVIATTANAGEGQGHYDYNQDHGGYHQGNRKRGHDKGTGKRRNKPVTTVTTSLDTLCMVTIDSNRRIKKIVTSDGTVIKSDPESGESLGKSYELGPYEDYVGTTITVRTRGRGGRQTHEILENPDCEMMEEEFTWGTCPCVTSWGLGPNFNPVQSTPSPVDLNEPLPSGMGTPASEILNPPLLASADGYTSSSYEVRFLRNFWVYEIGFTVLESNELLCTTQYYLNADGLATSNGDVNIVASTNPSDENIQDCTVGLNNWTGD